ARGKDRRGRQGQGRLPPALRPGQQDHRRLRSARSRHERHGRAASDGLRDRQSREGRLGEGRGGFQGPAEQRGHPDGARRSEVRERVGPWRCEIIRRAMALTSTIYNFDIDLADSDRGVYETLAVRAALHPSETEELLWTRVLAYCLEYEEGIAF